MDFNEIKKIIKEEKTKVIIASDDGPVMVVMDYEDYKKLKSGRVSTSKEESSMSQQSANPKATGKGIDSESLRIDDLPF